MTLSKIKSEAVTRRKPKTVVFNRSEEAISLSEVWIYPYAKMSFGARVTFFRANKEKKCVCCVYLEEDFVPDQTSNSLGDNQYKQFIDSICEIALKALVKKGFQIEEDFDVSISSGKLTYE